MHLSAIGVNAFRTTNFRSRYAMRGAKFHGNTCRDTTTSILSIPADVKKNSIIILVVVQQIVVVHLHVSQLTDLFMAEYR